MQSVNGDRGTAVAGPRSSKNGEIASRCSVLVPGRRRWRMRYTRWNCGDSRLFFRATASARTSASRSAFAPTVSAGRTTPSHPTANRPASPGRSGRTNPRAFSTAPVADLDLSVVAAAWVGGPQLEECGGRVDEGPRQLRRRGRPRRALARRVGNGLARELRRRLDRLPPAPDDQQQGRQEPAHAASGSAGRPPPGRQVTRRHIPIPPCLAGFAVRTAIHTDSGPHGRSLD